MPELGRLNILVGQFVVVCSHCACAGCVAPASGIVITRLKSLSRTGSASVAGFGPDAPCGRPDSEYAFCRVPGTLRQVLGLGCWSSSVRNPGMGRMASIDPMQLHGSGQAAPSTRMAQSGPSTQMLGSARRQCFQVAFAIEPSHGPGWPAHVAPRSSPTAPIPSTVCFRDPFCGRGTPYYCGKGSRLCSGEELEEETARGL